MVNFHNVTIEGFSFFFSSFFLKWQKLLTRFAYQFRIQSHQKNAKYSALDIELITYDNAIFAEQHIVSMFKTFENSKCFRSGLFSLMAK